MLIADDAPLQRAGWRMILESQPDITVIGEAGDGARALAIVRRESTDVVILDLHMPRVNGLAASARSVRANLPAIQARKHRTARLSGSWRKRRSSDHSRERWTASWIQKKKNHPRFLRL